MFCCLCLRSESAKQRYKHQQHRKRARYSECQTNQTRIRCISSHTVAPTNENGQALRENHRALREHLSSPTNANRDANGEANGEANRDANSKPNRNTICNTNSNPNRQCSTNGKRQSNKRPSAHQNGHPTVPKTQLTGANGQLNDRSNAKSNSKDPCRSNNRPATNEVNVVNKNATRRHCEEHANQLEAAHSEPVSSEDAKECQPVPAAGREQAGRGSRQATGEGSRCRESEKKHGNGIILLHSLHKAIKSAESQPADQPTEPGIER